MQTKKVSLCMIVKDEEMFLDRCLSSVKDLVSEIIIVDTGSKDKSKDIAQKYGAQIYDLTWEDDFSKARNQSLIPAKGDWILLLDADEELDVRDIPKFQTLMEDNRFDGYYFTLLNYFHEGNESEYTTHYAFRFLRNTGDYYFTGNIHEQIDKKGSPLDPTRFALADITIFHHGYTDTIVKYKNKRNRNMPLLKKALEESPDNPFFLFNMGNEYMADGQYTEALTYYEKAYKHRNIEAAYTPHLFYRMILCYIELKQYDKGLELAKHALYLYPLCTDIEFLKAIIYKKTYKHLLAINSLNCCIQMGEPPIHLKFLNDCATNRSYSLLCEIYLLEEDYENALKTYNLLYENTKTLELLYQIAPTLNKLYEEKERVVESLWQYLGFQKTNENIIFITRLLLLEGLLDKAQNALKELANTKNFETEYLYFTMELSFYKRHYDKTLAYLQRLFHKELNQTYLGNIYCDCLTYYYLVNLYKNEELDRSVEFLKSFSSKLIRLDNKNTYNTFALLLGMNMENNYIENIDFKKEMYCDKDTPYNNNNYYTLDETLLYQLIEKTLRCKEITYLDIFLPLFKHFKSQDKYLQLAKLYIKHDYKDLAIAAILDSINKNRILDEECALFLSRNLCPL